MLGIFFPPKLSIEEQSEIRVKYLDVLKFCPEFKSRDSTFLTFAELKFFSFLLLQGNWIAQWDTQYKAWFYYNIKTGFFCIIVGWLPRLVPSQRRLHGSSLQSSPMSPSSPRARSEELLHQKAPPKVLQMFLSDLSPIIALSCPFFRHSLSHCSCWGWM